MSMTSSQISAFENAAGFSPQLISTLWISLALTLCTLWCAWVLWVGYRGWANGDVRFGALGATATRVFLLLIVLMFFTLS